MCHLEILSAFTQNWFAVTSRHFSLRGLSSQTLTLSECFVSICNAPFESMKRLCKRMQVDRWSRHAINWSPRTSSLSGPQTVWQYCCSQDSCSSPRRWVECASISQSPRCTTIKQYVFKPNSCQCKVDQGKGPSTYSPVPRLTSTACLEGEGSRPPKMWTLVWKLGGFWG